MKASRLRDCLDDLIKQHGDCEVTVLHKKGELPVTTKHIHPDVLLHVAPKYTDGHGVVTTGDKQFIILT